MVSKSQIRKNRAIEYFKIEQTSNINKKWINIFLYVINRDRTDGPVELPWQIIRKLTVFNKKNRKSIISPANNRTEL
jgi:hypothetical protein